jgi:tripartite-type tricarboxylate transporter receptor subunit TctC
MTMTMTMTTTMTTTTTTTMTTKRTAAGRRHVLRTLGAGAAAAALPVRAQSFPTKPIRFVLPFPAGGPTDVVARTIGSSMAAQLGQPVVIENRPGGAGIVAAEYVARSPADGHTLHYCSSAFATSAALSRRTPFDPLRDFAFVGSTTTAPLALIVHPAFPARTPKEFVEVLRANPDKYSFGVVNRAITEVAPIQILTTLGLKATAIAYKGSAQAITDLVGGQVQFAMDVANSAMPFIRDGRVRALAIATRERYAALPEVPTVWESILRGYEAGTWGGLMAPAATPPAVIAQLGRSLQTTLADAEVRAKLEGQGLQIIAGTPDSFRELITREIERWRKVAIDANMPLE